jgi:Family of unknown function (DUF6496)
MPSCNFDSPVQSLFPEPCLPESAILKADRPHPSKQIPANKGGKMPEKATLERARKDKEEGKSPSTQAGEFVREEMDHIREGKHGARSSKQAIAIGLSKARRAGVDLKPPRKGRTSERTRKSAERDLAKGRGQGRAGSAKKKSASRSRATTQALKREPRQAASHAALSRQAKNAAKKRRQSGAATVGTRRRAASNKSTQQRAA